MCRAFFVLFVVYLSTMGAFGAVHGQKEANPRTGRYRDVLKEPKSDTAIVEFWMRAPDKLPSKKHLGVIFSFYGVGGGKNDNWESGNPPHYMYQAKLDQQYIFVSPRSKGDGWGTVDEEPLTKLIDWVLDNYPVDPRRVFLYGFSSGGFFIGPYGAGHMDRIAGVFAVAGNVGKLEKMQNASENGQEYYLVCGDNDGHMGASVKSNKLCQETGYRVIYRQVHGRTHEDIQGHDPTMTDGFKWIHALRHKNMPLTDEDKAALAKMEAKAEQAAFWTGTGAVAELGRIGGSNAGKVVVKGLKSSDAAARVAAARFCVDKLLGKDVVTTLAAAFLKKDETDDMHRAVAEALACYSAWRYAEAQTALCQTAWDKKRDASQRALALDAISKSVSLMMLGNFEDRVLFDTLFNMLMDKNQAVRTVAFTGLSPAVEGSYGYKPEFAPEKNIVALNQWQQWLFDKCGKPKQNKQGG